MELKVMLAQLLLDYEFYYPEERATRPKNIYFELGIIPDPSVKLVFRRRTEKSGA